jgi:hypothetical protein
MTATALAIFALGVAAGWASHKIDSHRKRKTALTVISTVFIGSALFLAFA